MYCRYTGLGLQYIAVSNIYRVGERVSVRAAVVCIEHVKGLKVSVSLY